MEARSETPLFSLAPGGPVDRLLVHLHMRHSERPHALRRAIIAALVTWVPLLVLSLFTSDPGTEIPFLRDIFVHVRFLIIVPMLVLVEGPIGMRSRMVATQFLDSGLVADADAGEYERAMKRGLQLVDSWLAELLILGASAALVWFTVHGAMMDPPVFWFERATPAGHALTPAGWWNFGVANPIFMFLLLRWLWRYLVWWWFLGRTARLDLRFTGTHPDRMGGMGFVTFHQSVFCLITVAVSCGISAAAADRILTGHATLKEYQNPIIAFALLAVVMGVAPMLVFTSRLVAAKRAGWGRYSRLASEYVWRFENKWMPGPASDELLGTSDIQSLADIGGSFERMVTMRAFAIDRRLVFSFLFAAVGPMLPLLLTMMPLREIVKILFNALM